MALQLIYTKCPDGAGLKRGFNIYSKTDGIRSDDLNEVIINYSMYTVPEYIHIKSVDDPIIDELPLEFSYAILDSGNKVTTQVKYKGEEFGHTGRLGNFIAHSMIMGSMEDYPIRFYSSPEFCQDLHLDDMDLSKPPEPLKEIQLRTGENALTEDRIKEFLNNNSSEFLVEFVYRILNQMTTRKNPVILSSPGDDNVFWIGAATMMFPLKMSSRVSFITFTGAPDKCPHDIIGIQNTECLRESLQRYLLSADAPAYTKELYDPVFTDFIISAYSPDSDSDEFYAFLDEMDYHGFDNEIVQLYALYWILKQTGEIPPETAENGINTFKKYNSRLNQESKIKFFDRTAPIADPELTEFFQNQIISTLDTDEQHYVRHRIFESRMESFSKKTHVDVKDLTDHHNLISECYTYGYTDLLSNIPCAYASLKYWCDPAEHFEKNITELNRCFEFTDELASLCLEDVPLVEKIIIRGCPVDEEFLMSIKKGIIEKCAEYSDTVLKTLFIEFLNSDSETANELINASKARDDYDDLFFEYISAVLDSDHTEKAAELIKDHSERLTDSDSSLLTLLRFVKDHVNKAGTQTLGDIIRTFNNGIESRKDPDRIQTVIFIAEEIPDYDQYLEDPDYIFPLYFEYMVKAGKRTSQLPNLSEMDESWIADYLVKILPERFEKEHDSNWMAEILLIAGDKCRDDAESMISEIARRTFCDAPEPQRAAAYLMDLQQADPDVPEEILFEPLKTLKEKEKYQIRKKLESLSSPEFLEIFDQHMGTEPKKSLFGFGKTEKIKKETKKDHDPNDDKTNERDSHSPFHRKNRKMDDSDSETEPTRQTEILKNPLADKKEKKTLKTFFKR